MGRTVRVIQKAASCLLLLYVLAPISSAQVSAGNLVVLTNNNSGPSTVQSLWSLPAGGGAPIQITGFTPSILNAAGSVEVEPSSGDVLLAVPSTGQIWRAALSGLTVTSETLLVTLPTIAGPVMDTHLEIDAGGTPTGCLLVLSSLTNNPLAISPNAVIYRVSIGPASAVAVAVPFAYPGATPPEILAGITSDTAGTIYLAFAQPGLPFPHAAGAYSLPAAGGTLSTVYSGLPVSPRSVSVDLTGIVVVGGIGNTTPQAPNYWCGSAGILLSPAGFPFTPPITDIILDSGSATYTVAENGGLTGAAGLGHLRRIPTGSCSPAAVTVVADFADPIVAIGQAVLGNRYGCGCVASSGSAPLLTELTPPVPGTTWNSQLTGTAPGASASLILGPSNTMWSGGSLPADLTAAGAPGCVLLTSGDWLTLNATASGSGTATFSFAVPAGFPMGVPLFSQGYYIDAGSPNPLPIATSNAVATGS